MKVTGIELIQKIDRDEIKKLQKVNVLSPNGKIYSKCYYEDGDLLTIETNEDLMDSIKLGGLNYYHYEIIEEPKTNFNIGDRVKNIKNMSKLDYCNKYIGLKGTIINIDDSDNGEPYFVKFDNGEKEWFKHNELELVEESKEELEEIELIDIHYVNDKCIFKVYGQSIDETIAIKVNELIANQNKIVRELKANKKQ